MNAKKLSPRELRERKFLFRAPLFAAPALALLFWGFGGARAEAVGSRVKQGFNMNMPLARLPRDSAWDKWTYYRHALQDSLAMAARLKSEADFAKKAGIGGDRDSVDSARRVDTPDVHVANVQRKLERLNKALAEPPPVVKPMQSIGENPDIARLEKIMGVLKKPEQEEDTQMEQINGVLDKLIAAQHPGRNNDSGQRAMRASVPRETMGVQAVGDSGAGGTVSLAVLVPDEQVLVSGAELRLELAEDVLVNGVRIPRGSPVYGVASLSGERLRVLIRSLVDGERVFPVSLQVVDQDGLSGIYIPGAPTSDAVRESADQDLGSLGLEGYSPTLAGQAAGAGVQLGRSLIGKKIRRVRVVVPAGYRLILRDSQKND